MSASPEGAIYFSPGRKPWVGGGTIESRRDGRNAARAPAPHEQSRFLTAKAVRNDRVFKVLVDFEFDLAKS